MNPGDTPSAPAFAFSPERLKVLHENAEALFDPFGVIAPIAHAHNSWLLHPIELAELWARTAGDFAAFQAHAVSRLAGRESPDVVRAQPDDQRFSDPVWTKEPAGRAEAVVSLRHASHAGCAVPDARPLAQERRRAAFWWRSG